MSQLTLGKCFRCANFLSSPQNTCAQTLLSGSRSFHQEGQGRWRQGLASRDECSAAQGDVRTEKSSAIGASTTSFSVCSKDLWMSEHRLERCVQTRDTYRFNVCMPCMQALPALPDGTQPGA